jgi:hypothetical protein
MVLGHCHENAYFPSKRSLFRFMYLFDEKQYLVIVGEGFSRSSFFQVFHTSPYLMSLLVTQEFEYLICSCSSSDLFSLSDSLFVGT